MKVYTCNNLNQLNYIAKELINKHNNAKIFSFYGNMGVGKTTFIKEICKYLQVEENVISPTFSIINQYYTQNGNIIYHFDLYRIKNITEIYDIGYEDYIYSNNICLIEWPEIIEHLLPLETIKIFIDVDDNNNRIITF
jgi:tRNA threonylcarbamoyladenosine biosynthesis protein TsaE